MKIILTPEESELYFYNALCNGLGYIGGYGLELRFNEDDYQIAKKSLKNKGTNGCYEDILMEMLRNGKSLILRDLEGSEDDAIVTLKEVHERVQLTPIRYLTEMIEEEDDADTADQILQTVFLEDIVYG